jgi:SAM-dependent methyltransferase
VADDVVRHYETLLAEHYTWMIGVPFEKKVEEQRTLLESLGTSRGAHGLAVDLGSGPGFQSCALARLGYSRVIAVDTSRLLLDELVGHVRDLPIETVHADLRALMARLAPNAADAIVCMGDTLTHLDGRADVSRLFSDAYRTLVPGGVFVLGFRDLSIERVGLDRIVPVRADNDRILTCVLDYESDVVVVSDVLYIRNENGWSVRKGSYRKLRLAAGEIADELNRLGFAIKWYQPSDRMHVIAAEK